MCYHPLFSFWVSSSFSTIFNVIGVRAIVRGNFGDLKKFVPEGGPDGGTAVMEGALSSASSSAATSATAAG